MSDRYGRPDDAPEPNHPLLLAARYNDASSQEHGFEETCKKYGVEPEHVVYVAEQRALRYAMMRTGEGERLDEMHKKGHHATPFRPTPVQQAMIDFLIPVYIDGIMLGWRAQELST